jgi:hypothetical protein
MLNGEYKCRAAEFEIKKKKCKSYWIYIFERAFNLLIYTSPRMALNARPNLLTSIVKYILSHYESILTIPLHINLLYGFMSQTILHEPHKVRSFCFLAFCRLQHRSILIEELINSLNLISICWRSELKHKNGIYFCITIVCRVYFLWHLCQYKSLILIKSLTFM